MNCLLEFFKYNPNENTVSININEYNYDKKVFNLDTDKEECIKEINRLYNQCNDDRISYDTDANTEYYLREHIQNIPLDELNFLKRRLDYVKNDEKIKIEHQIEILEKIVEKIDDAIY